MPDLFVVLGAVLFLLPVAALMPLGCGLIMDFDPRDQTLVIQPETRGVGPGGWIQFSAMVTPVAGSDSVTFSASLEPNAGTVTRIPGFFAWNYTAPSDIPAPMEVTFKVKAERLGYTTAIDTSIIRLLPGPVTPPELSVTISPERVELGPDETAPFTVATVPGGVEVRHDLVPDAGRVETLGDTWIYTAPSPFDPAGPRSVVLRAQATRAGEFALAEAQIALAQVEVWISPPGISLRPGQSFPFVAEVRKNDVRVPPPFNQVNWSPNAPGGTYSHPAPLNPGGPSTEDIRAASLTWPSVQGMATVTLVGPVLRINCGGPAVADPAGEKDWLDDALDGSFMGVNYDVVDHAIPGSSGTVRHRTEDFRFSFADRIYRTCKYGHDFTYRFKGFVAGTTYRVTLKFGDLFTGSGGQLSDVTITGADGSRAIAVTPSAVMVEDHVLSARANPGGGFEIRFAVHDRINFFAFINAIEISLG